MSINSATYKVPYTTGELINLGSKDQTITNNKIRYAQGITLTVTDVSYSGYRDSDLDSFSNPNDTHPDWMSYEVMEGWDSDSMWQDVLVIIDPSKIGSLLYAGREYQFIIYYTTDIGGADNIPFSYTHALEPGEYIPPATSHYELGGVMGKDQICEDLAGQARVVWMTTQRADSEIWVTITTDVSGNPISYTKMVDDSDMDQSHDYQFGVLAVDSTHYFYVKSINADSDELISGVYCFNSGSEVTLEHNTLAMLVDASLFSASGITATFNGFSDDVVLPTTGKVEDLGDMFSVTLSSEVASSASQSMGTFGDDIEYKVDDKFLIFASLNIAASVSEAVATAS